MGPTRSGCCCDCEPARTGRTVNHPPPVSQSDSSSGGQVEEEEEGIGEVIVVHWWGPSGELGAGAQPGVLLEESSAGQVRELLKRLSPISLPSGDWQAGGNPSP